MIYKSLFHAMNISAQGLSVQRTRMNVIAENLANVDTTKTEDGGPYRRKLVQLEQGVKGERFVDVFQKNQIDMKETNKAHKPSVPFRKIAEEPKYGVHVSDIVKDPSAFKQIYDPYHPDANEDGYVSMPNINTVQEMIDMITASRSYEANVTALNNSKDMIRNALKI